MPRIAVIVALAAAVAAFVACQASQEGDPPDPQYDLLMADGKRLLEAGEGRDAARRFYEAERLRPGDSNAYLGVAIATAQKLLILADDAIDFGAALAGQEVPESDADAPYRAREKSHHRTPEGTDSGTILRMLLSQIFDDPLAELIDAYDVAAADKGIAFEVGPIPLVFEEQPLLKLTGDWDSADVAFSGAFAHALRALVDTIIATDFGFDFASLMDAILVSSRLPADESTGYLLGVVLELLTDPNHPGFLLDNAESEYRMPRAGLALGRFCDMMIEALTTVTDAVGPFGYVVIIDNHVHDPSEPYRFADLDPFSRDLMDDIPALLVILEEARDSFWDGTEIDVHPGEPDPFDLSLVNDLFDDLPPLLPSVDLDFGGYFLDPRPELFKDFVVELLGCAVDYPDDTARLVFCLANALATDES
ncbi:hypothetical protein K8I61_04830 [bacterium]|nr:hypothetical protein [bacterium]